jgi:hypothetical protein
MARAVADTCLVRIPGQSGQLPGNTSEECNPARARRTSYSLVSIEVSRGRLGPSVEGAASSASSLGEVELVQMRERASRLIVELISGCLRHLARV